jgi:cbb3-type cytochrome oxidase subunit 3
MERTSSEIPQPIPSQITRRPLSLKSTKPIVTEMTGDTFTLVVLLTGGFVVFLGAIWFIERRGNRAKAKRERRKFKL